VTFTIDEQGAWELVRAVIPRSGDGIGPTRVHAGTAQDIWLDVDRSGSWKVSHAVTDVARDVFDLYLPLQLTVDFVIGQLGQSLDGRIATEGGASHFVTGPEDIRRLHRLRALVDAVIVGANTVESDDPQLTVRAVEGDNPVRVILDASGRLGRDRRVFWDGAAPTIVCRRAPDGRREAETREGEILVSAMPSGDLDVRALLKALRAQGLRRVLVEGGGVTVSRFLQAGALDRLHITVAPLVIGSGRPSLTLDPITTLDQALRPPCRQFRLGADTLFDLDLSPASS